ncbi:MAG: AAA family ATPase [bacterium]
MLDSISPIKRFEILGLHGDRDVVLEFENPVKILVDENGSGKTTVLNALYSVLSGNWYKLLRIQFTKILLMFTAQKDNIVIDRVDLEAEGLFDSSVLQELRLHLPSFEIERLAEMAIQMPPAVFSHRIESIADSVRIPSRVIYQELNRAARLPRSRGEGQSTSKKIAGLTETIKKAFPYPFLYLPTYRRVEEDLSNLGYSEKDLRASEQLIQFGMHDVKRRFDRITSEIKTSSVEWYSIINGKMLTQLISGIQNKSIEFARIENPDALRIVLDRIGENISKEDKEHILELIDTKGVKQEKYAPLAYFLSNLIQVYDQQRENDNAIKNFARVSNEYLTDKEIRYNESKVDIQVINKNSGKAVDLDRLSSGEKQLVSILSRLYLDKSGPYAILIDEPELSLSMEWQKKLLLDISKSSQCVFLMAATHSPFIFQNELDRFASTLTVHFKHGNFESR